MKFFPSPGPVKRFDTPVPADGAFHDGVRIDAGVRAGDTVTPYYDSLLAKIIAHAPTRAEAIARMREALGRFTVEGVKTNIPLHLKVTRQRKVRGRRAGHSLHREALNDMADVPAHITGTVWKIEKKVGDEVKAGDVLVILESMKMEMPVEAPEDGKVAEIRCKEAQPVNEGDVLVVLGK